MTAVIWSPAHQVLATDCRSSYSNGRYSDETMKLGYGKDFVAAWSGDLSFVRKFFQKWMSATDRHVDIGASFVEVISDLEHAQTIHDEMTGDNDSYFNLVLFYLDDREEVQGLEFTNGAIFTHFDTKKPYALGSGGDICLGAVYAGTLPEEAIAIAADITTSVSHKSNNVNVLGYLLAKKHG